MRKAVFCVMALLLLTGCGEKVGEDSSYFTESLEVESGIESPTVVLEVPSEVTSSEESEPEESSSEESESVDMEEVSVPDLSNNEKGINGLPIITYGDIRSNPQGYEMLGLWREYYEGMFRMREFMVKPTAFILDGVVMNFGSEELDFDSFVQSLSDFSQVFYMSSGSTDNGLRPSSVEEIKAYLNKNIGTPRSISFTSPEMKELVTLDANIYISIRMSTENVIDSLKVEFHTSEKLSEQPLVVFENIGVNVALLNESGKAFSLDFDLK